MRRHKYRLNLLSYCDGARVCRRLERMAARGWQLDDVGLLWRYRRAPAQALHYEAVYCPQAELLAPRAGEGAQELVDYCAQEDWTLAAQWRQMLLFSNPYPDPVPIETDPQVQLDAIHRVMKGAMLTTAAIAGYLSLRTLSTFLRMISQPSPLLLASPLLMLILALTPLLLLSFLAEPALYLLWYRKARRAAGQGEPLPPVRHRFLRRVDSVLTPAVLLLILAFLFRDPGVGWPFLLTILLILLVLPLFLALQQLFRRLGLDGGTNRLIMGGVSLLLAVLILLLAIPQLFQMGEQGAFSAGTGERVTRWRDGEQVDYLRQDPLPLTLEDLGESEGGRWSYELERYASPLLSLAVGEQRHAFSDVPELSYEVMAVHLPSLTPKILELAMEEHSASLSFRELGRFVSADAAPWGADEAYQRLWDGEPQPVYLLRKGDTIVYLSLSSEFALTPAAVSTIREALLP